MNKIRSFFGSVVAQVGFVVVLLAALTAAAIATAYRVFVATDADMAELVQQHVPSIRAGSEVMRMTSSLGDNLTDILLADSPAALEVIKADLNKNLTDLGKEVSRLPSANLAEYSVPLATVRNTLGKLIEARNEAFQIDEKLEHSISDLHAISARINLRLVELTDEAYFKASIATESVPDLGAASGQSIGAIAPDTRADEVKYRRNMSKYVDELRNSQALGYATQLYYSNVLEASLATDEADLIASQENLTTTSGTISRLSSRATMDITSQLGGFEAYANADTGIVALKRASLAARVRVAALSETANAKVTEIQKLAGASNASTLDTIAQSSGALAANIGSASALLKVQMIASAIIVILAMGYVYLLIARPLRAAVNATDRLSHGDLEAVDRLRQRRFGEIGLLVSALHVFRDGIVENRRLQDEEQASRERQLEATRAAEQAERDRENRERERAQAAQEELRRREAEEAAHREELRQAADAERQARAAAQNRVVTSLADGLRRLASGDLRVQIAETFEEGYEQLRVDFNAAVASLSGALSEILSASDAILANSNGISQAAQDLSRRTEQSAATLEQTAAALHQLAAAVSSAAQGSQEADGTAADARKTAENGDAMVRKAVETMGGIAESSNRISRIIDVIDDIAFQTNLLALNAGVEAARAGEAGRGFAVVASEVRALSQRSSEAAREIGALIADSVRQVDDGVTVVNDLGSALGDILRTVSHISSSVSGIAVSAREQSAGIGEINVAVGHLERSVQQNAAMVEETTAATQELREQARTLSQTLEGFTLDGPVPLDTHSDETGPSREVA